MAKQVKTFEVTLRAPEARLAELIALATDKDYLLVGCREVAGSATVAKKTIRYEGGKRNKGIRAKDLLLSLLHTGPATFAELQESFASRGFAKASCQPALNGAKHDGLTETDGTKIWLSMAGSTAAAAVVEKLSVPK